MFPHIVDLNIKSLEKLEHIPNKAKKYNFIWCCHTDDFIFAAHYAETTTKIAWQFIYIDWQTDARPNPIRSKISGETNHNSHAYVDIVNTFFIGIQLLIAVAFIIIIP